VLRVAQYQFSNIIFLNVPDFWDWAAFLVVSTTGVRQIAAQKAVNAAPFS